LSERELRLTKEGLEAWRQGEFSAIESMLDPGATWRSFEPGEWDCENRDDILRTLRERHEQGFARGELEVVDGGPDAVIVVSHPRDIGGEDWPEETATVISFRDAKIVALQDYRTRNEAVAAVS
jgi:ketosteroid isomerase-like protein